MLSGSIVALIILGIILLILEIFIPGGVLGVAGLIVLSTGLFMSADSALQGISYVSTMLLILGLLIALSFKFPRTRRFWKRFSLTDHQSNSEGYVAPAKGLEQFVGRKGVAISTLRPAGVADFDGERVDVVTEGGYIIKGAFIKVIGVEGTRVIVREDVVNSAD